MMKNKVKNKEKTTKHVKNLQNNKITSWLVMVILLAIGSAFLITGATTEFTLVSDQRQLEKFLITKSNANLNDPLIIAEINQMKLQELQGKEYNRLKRELNMNSDFLIFFEGDEGKVIEIEKGKHCIGLPQVCGGPSP